MHAGKASNSKPYGGVWRWLECSNWWWIPASTIGTGRIAIFLVVRKIMIQNVLPELWSLVLFGMGFALTGTCVRVKKNRTQAPRDAKPYGAGAGRGGLICVT